MDAQEVQEAKREFEAWLEAREIGDVPTVYNDSTLNAHFLVWLTAYQLGVSRHDPTAKSTRALPH